MDNLFRAQLKYFADSRKAMNAEERAALQERRKTLQKKIAADQARQRIDHQLRQLAEANIAHEVVDDSDALLQWLQKIHPFERCGIDWSAVQEQQSYLDASTEGAAVWLRQISVSCSAENAMVTVLWDGGYPGISLQFGDFISMRDHLTGFETWIIPASRAWVIEHSSAGWFWGANK